MVTWVRDHLDALVLVSLVLVVGGVNLFWSAHLAEQTGHSFCQIVGTATAHPVPKPADPEANPSRENGYIFYREFVELGHRLGCPRR
jgi:hypothetical protein